MNPSVGLGKGAPGRKRIPRAVAQERMLALLERCALAGEPCPTNPELGAALGYDQSYPAALVRLLELEGAIAVKRGGRGRVVTILADGPAKGLSTSDDGHRRFFGGTGNFVRHIGAANDQVGGSPAVPVDQLVARDPCPRCGVRGDVGCRHRTVLEPWRI
jgi:hypothetical protein